MGIAKTKHQSYHLSKMYPRRNWWTQIKSGHRPSGCNMLIRPEKNNRRRLDLRKFLVASKNFAPGHESVNRQPAIDAFVLHLLPIAKAWSIKSTNAWTWYESND